MFFSDTTDVCMRDFLPSEEGKVYPMPFTLSACVAPPETHTHARTHTRAHTWWNHRQVEGCSQEWQMKETGVRMDTWELQLFSAWILPCNVSCFSPLQISVTEPLQWFSMSVKYIIWGNASSDGKVDTFSVWLMLTQLQGLTGSAFIIKWHYDIVLGTMMEPPFILFICL